MPTNPYTATPYYGSDVLSGANTRGDSANGLYGSLTPSALANQQVNSAPSSGNPYAEILNYIQPRVAQTQTPTSYFGTNPDGTRRMFAGAEIENPDPNQNTNGPGGPTPPPPAPPPGSGTQGQQPPPPGGNTQGQLPQAAGPNPHPEWWSDWAWVKAHEWGSTPGYEYLAQNPGYVMDYYNWVNDGGGVGQDRSQVDIVDWLAAQGINSPQAGRRGYDTYNKNADGSNTAWTAPPPPEIVPPPQPVTYGVSTNPDGTRHVVPQELSQQYTPGQQTAPTAPPPPQPTPPANTPPPTNVPPNPVQPPTTQPPTTTPDQPKLADQNPQYTNTPVPQTTTPTGQNPSDVYGLLQQLLSPEFGYESNQLSRNMAAAAALNGGLNSGGYLESLGRAQSQLSANQGQRLSDYLNTDYQNSLDRALQMYGINTTANTADKQTQMQGFIARLQDDTARLGIQTNADLQKYLDSNDNALKQYGIDKNDLLQRYQAELQLQGVKYSSDAQIQTAAFNKAASTAMAHAQEAADVARIQSQQKLSEEGMANQYNESAANLAWQQYQYGHLSASDLLNAYLMFTPEQLAHLGLPPLNQVYGP